MSTICITHLAVLCNYAPLFRYMPHVYIGVNSIRVIRMPHEYTLHRQQIPHFYFLTQRFITAFCFSSRTLSLSFPMTRQRQIPKQLFLGQYLLNRKRRGRGGEKDKREKWSRRNFLVLASRCCEHTTKSEGDCRRHTMSMRDQRGSMLCSAYLKHSQ